LKRIGAWNGSGNTPRQRKRKARLLYDFEMECREQGWGDPAFAYYEEHDLFRWTAASSSRASTPIGRCSGNGGKMKGFESIVV
jgi:hypothetical protein